LVVAERVRVMLAVAVEQVVILLVIHHLFLEHITELL
jgi:hypothetical protein